jgi:hypothetical protein
VAHAGALEGQRPRLPRGDVEQVALAGLEMTDRLAPPRITTGVFFSRAPARARSGRGAPPPSEIMQQSSRWSGDEIMREASTSSTVIGSRYFALGLSPACRRMVTAISASCSLVVPYSCMCRCATSAYDPTMVGPNGASKLSGGSHRERAARADREALRGRRRSVGDERHLAEPRRDRRRRVQAVRHERRAADRLRSRDTTAAGSGAARAT